MFCLGQALKDNRGNILPMAAVGVLVISAMVGGAVDMGRAYKVKSRLQAACDAGSLAGRKAVVNSGFDTTALGQANTYFNADFDEGAIGTRNTVFVATSPDSGHTVIGSATTMVDTALMRIFGKDTFSIAVTCSASMGVGNSDVTMVLDTTGSMGGALGSTTRIRMIRNRMP